MLETVTTNGATILTMLALWSTVTWALTYIYMGRKVTNANECIDALDWYCYYSDREIEKLLAEKRETERVYGHVLDDYTDYYLTDKGLGAL